MENALDVVKNIYIQRYCRTHPFKKVRYSSSLLQNATTGASIKDSLVKPRALTYTSRIAYVSHA